MTTPEVGPLELVDCRQLDQATYAQRRDGKLHCTACHATDHRTIAEITTLVNERYGPLAADRYQRAAAARAAQRSREG